MNILHKTSYITIPHPALSIERVGISITRMVHNASVRMCLCLMLCLTALASCSEEDTTVNEYDDWKARNETYFEQQYNLAQSKIDAGDTSWKMIRVYTKNYASTVHTDYVIAHVISQTESHNEWDGSYSGEQPEYTDSVQVHYRGNLMPSASYTNGYQFDSSWIGDYNLQTMLPSNLLMSDNVVGFSSTLMQMHVGDRWEIIIPYQLGYNTTETTGVPAYSTLHFDLTLQAIGKPGKTLPIAR